MEKKLILIVVLYSKFAHPEMKKEFTKNQKHYLKLKGLM